MNGEQTAKKRSGLGWLLLVVVMVAVFCLGLLAASITERKAEVASIYNNKKVEIGATESNNSKWGLNYPREYETWKMTEKTDFRSKHMSSALEDQLEQRPDMVILWAGYGFSRDYNSPRGHMYALEDMRASLRTGAPIDGKGDSQPGTCWTCKSPDVVRLIAEHGAAKYYGATWSTWGKEVVHPIGCADCHDAATMNLKVTRPALIEAMQRQGKDITKATQQELRSLVCAQCHEEYYWDSKKYLIFPFDKGQTVEDIEAYFDELNYKDFTHALSRAPILKAQHPGWSVALLGPHGKHNVSCADCHMPYKSEGGIKYSDHRVISPLANIARTCQTCHREDEETLRGYVYYYQDKGYETRAVAEKALVKAHIMAKAAWDAGATEEEMKEALTLIRHSQWRWDYAVASHGAPFHAPAEFQRILATSIQKALEAQLVIQKVLLAHGVNEVVMPDVSTKDKALAYIGIDLAKLKAAKKNFLEVEVPKWIEAAKKEGRL